MLAGQRAVATDGVEICLFPFEYMYITQGENQSPTHMSTYNIDFLGYGASGRVYNCPFYAPVTLRCIDAWDYSGSHNLTYQSVNKVYLANGQKNYLTIDFAHDDTPIHNVGDIIQQGALLGHTGTFGQVTGDHTHSCCGMGTFTGYTERQTDCYDLTNRIHYYDACYVNDTVLVQDEGYPWKTWNGPIPPLPSPDKNKFPWTVYLGKLKRN